MDIGSNGRFIFGLAAPSIATVRVEHNAGAPEVFKTAAATAYVEHFWAGEIVNPAPISRIVGLDADGAVVAQRTDNDNLNQF
jgi:hypothetical protein